MSGWSPMEVNLYTRLDRDIFYLEGNVSQPTYSVQPVFLMEDPLLPLITIFPAPGYLAPHLQPTIAMVRRREALKWLPIAVPPGSGHVYGTSSTASFDRRNVGRQEPPVDPLIPSNSFDPGCILHVRSKGQRARGIPLSEIPVTCVDQAPDKDGVVYRDGLVSLDAVREVVDCPDWCVCHLVEGPTVRLAGIGAEWRGSLVEQPGFPVRKRGSDCFTFGRLFQLVVEHFLTWWINEEETRAKELSALEVRQERLPLMPGPGTIPLENIVLVGIRRRHIALGVYEWFPEIEVTL